MVQTKVENSNCWTELDGRTAYIPRYRISKTVPKDTNTKLKTNGIINSLRFCEVKLQDEKQITNTKILCCRKRSVPFWNESGFEK